MGLSLLAKKLSGVYFSVNAHRLPADQREKANQKADGMITGFSKLKKLQKWKSRRDGKYHLGKCSEVRIFFPV